MSKCLVTGHMGYIGSKIFTKLIELGHEVKGMDLKQGREWDICYNLKAKYLRFKPDYIFHLAAIPRVPYSMEFPEKVLENNILSTIRVLEYARESGTKRIIYSSSSSVVGNGNGPTSPYGASKLVPEILCKNYSDVYGLDTVSLRDFNVYSEDQKAEDAYATAIANFMEFIRTGKQPFITGDGEQRRDMIHVMDVVSANIFCMNHKDNFEGQFFDVATGENISLNEVKEIVVKYHPEVTFEYVPERKGDVRTTCAHTEPLRNLGWTTRINIMEGLEACFRAIER